MYYYLILFILVFYSIYNLLGEQYNKKKNENYYCLIICIVLVLLAAFRSNEVGTDTLAYRPYYLWLGEYPTFTSLIDRYTEYYIGYYGLSKIFHNCGLSVEVWFGFVEGLYLFSLMLLVNKFSKDKIFSLLVFTTIGLFTFSMAGLKQTVGASFIMISFICFVDKKYILAIAFAILTYYTHQAALVLLFAYPAYFMRNSKYLVPIMIVSCLVLYFYSTLLIDTAAEILDNEQFDKYNVNESEYSYVTFIFYITITLLCFIFRKNNENYKFFMGMSFLASGLQLLAGVSPSLFRLANIYTPFMMILLPNTVYFAEKRYRSLLRYALIFSIVFYFLYTCRNTPYSFESIEDYLFS